MYFALDHRKAFPGEKLTDRKLSIHISLGLYFQVMYTKKNHFGGVMVWAVDLDDTSGACGGGPYPLMNAIKKGLLDSTGTVVG